MIYEPKKATNINDKESNDWQSNEKYLVCSTIEWYETEKWKVP